jgi:dienelactone hydrolase
MTEMKEAACQFGANAQLIGVITEPATSDARTAFVLVSAGLIPKAGPYRLYAQLARDAAAAGFLSLRFDLGGIGDSRQDLRSVPLKERTRIDISAAIDYLSASRGIERVVLCGLCSGAEDSVRYAEKDARVAGVAAIDPFAYRTSGWAWRHFLHRLARRSLRALKLYQPLIKPPVLGTSGDGGSLVNYNYMPYAESERILKTLLARGVRVHFVYTGGMRESFNHAGQLRKMFRGSRLGHSITLEYLPRMEHTQELEEDRNAVLDSIGRWLRAG